MWDAFVDAWAIAAGAVPALSQPSEELQRAASILLGLHEPGLMTQLDGAGELEAQFPRRSSLLKGVQLGSRVAVEVTLARIYPDA